MDRESVVAAMAAFALLATIASGGCVRPGAVTEATAGPPIAALQAATEVRGTVSFDPPALPGSRFRIQAELAEVANAATVSLIDAQTGNTVSSAVTDERGAFVLSFRNFSPVTGASYTLCSLKSQPLV